MSAGPLVQINSTIIRPYHNAHYNGMEHCIMRHYSSGDGHFLKNVLILFNRVIFIFSSCHFHWHTLHILFVQIFTFAVTRAQVGNWYSPGHAQDKTNTLFIVYTLFSAASFFPALPGHWLLATWRDLQAASGYVRLTALCDQLDNIAFPRLWGSDVPTVQPSSIHVASWTVIAKSNPPSGLDALIRATASPCLLLDVPILHRHSFGNMTF
jgi:hypothetical protein